MRALAQHGPCPQHRASFANVNGLVRDLPPVDQDVDEQEVAGPAVDSPVDGPVVDGQAGDGVGCRPDNVPELLGGELAYR